MTAPPQAEVDAQLLEHGAFSPLELLFSSGRLFQGDYDAWRRREVEFLDSVLMGNPAKIREELELAACYARSLGLEAQPQEFHAADAGTAGGIAKPALRISADAYWHQLIASRYVPARQAPQLDLFVDNPVVALSTGIVRALATRDLEDAQRRLDRLYEQAPNHPDLPGFDRLLAALRRLQEPGLAPRAEHDLITGITPTARRLLGSHARELLAPLWRARAAHAASQPFSADAPELHASHALAQAQDWAGVEEAVLKVPEWWLLAPLAIRLAESAFQRRRRTEGLSAWCHACWRAPGETARTVTLLKQPELTSLWRKFVDEEAEEEEALLAEADFPAWLLLHEPGLARQLPESLPTGATSAEEGYRLVHRWLTARREARREEELTLRRRLHADHPPLFRLLKRALGPGIAPASR
jgi:hypothetical protein